MDSSDGQMITCEAEEKLPEGKELNVVSSEGHLPNRLARVTDQPNQWVKTPQNSLVFVCPVFVI